MSLREFLKQMEAEGEVLHIKEKLSPKFEIAAIMKALDKGPILIFEKVKGESTKIVANVCATRERICKALNVERENLYSKLVYAWKNPSKPKIAKDSPVKEVVREDFKLSEIPVLTHFEHDAGPYITSAIVSAKSPDKKVENVSIHRLQVLGEDKLAIRLVPRQLHKLWTMAKEADQELDVAISIGLHPAVSLAATAPLPFGVSEFEVANTLLEGKFKLIECEHVDAYAPAEAEIILEGKLSTSEEVDEGPLVDITGTYDVVRKQPTIKIVGVMHRKDYIYQALLPSGNEHKLLMGLSREVAIWETVSKVVPKVEAVNLSSGGCGWLHAIISIEKQTEGDGKNALLAAFSAHPSLKHAVVVDTDINVYDIEEVEWAVATRFQADKDLLIIKNVRGSTLDPSANQETGTTTKMGIDATRPLDKPKEKFEKAKTVSSKRVNEVIEELRKIKA
ncbi:UbiD family decarboxylase [Candidatus Bathyarchaeota archaeon]|nr:MAG: UbiD family decarboxylase [Candidatus Bathyarchaeota archaeon]